MLHLCMINTNLNVLGLYNNNPHVVILIESWETYVQFSFYFMFSNSPNFLTTKYVYVKDCHNFDAPLAKGNCQ